ncbi:hypothetical protein [Flavobacterium cyclinae]|uniref:hypothetical protein n=1 Tax=Flavobacterium cyclinae TaxID=2895947 RepID=UPI001E4F3073|nr:hypothetical protein [Flavobacterium cyclinae]UGS22071.1 hypothetical protein LOS86_05470 [Flavobacterium cyclinae]
MKISILKTLVITLSLLLSENVICQNSEFELTELISTDELFKTKNLVTEENSVDFLRQFYALSLVEKISQSEDLKLAVLNIIDKDIFSCSELDVKKVLNFIKKSKTKNEILKEIEKNFNSPNSFFNETAEEGIAEFELLKLTEETYALNAKVCGSGAGYHNQFLLVHNFDTVNPNFIDGDKFLEGIFFTAKSKLEKKLNAKFNRQFAKMQNFGTTQINGEDYITLPYYQGNENIGGFLYDLIIAYNFKSNSFYYIYDNPNSENDNWKRDRNDLDFQFYTWVTEKNPNWKTVE